MRIFSILLALAMISSCLFAENTSPPRTITATLKSSDIKIDGVMESAWLASECADDFIQKQPEEGKSGSEATKCYLLYDPDALYVLFNCYDGSPDSILGRIQRRDNDGLSDFIDFFLDTFHDRRNAYWWTVTAAGVQAEGTMYNENSLDAAWDAVWESAAGRNDSGWVAEFKIPFHSIRHNGCGPEGWGIQFARRIERHQEYNSWVPISRERDLRVGEFGTLLGLKNIASSKHIELLPHAVGRFDASAKTSDNSAKDTRWRSENEWENLGITMKLVPSDSWTADFAYQPDFAQVDVDNEQINVSDYPLFLSEKRPFFLDVKNLFDSSPITMFYTRRIGDPDYIGRINGQWSRVRGTLLAANNINEYGQKENAFVGRSIFNIGKANTLGVTTTHLQRDRDNFHASTAGIDGRIRWGKWDGARYSFTAVDRTDQAGHHVEPFEFRGGANVDLGLLRSDIVTRYRGKDYNVNDLGFGDFSNVSETFFWMGENWHPKGGFLDTYGLDINSSFRMHSNGTHQQGFGGFNWFFTSKSNWDFGAGWEYGDNFRRRYTGEDTDSPMRDNFGEFYTQYYHYHSFWGWINSDNRKPIEYGLNNIGGGKFRDGHKFDISPYLVFKPRSNLDFTPSMDLTQIWGNQDFDLQTAVFSVIRLRARYSPTLDLSFRATIQYLDDRYHYGGEFYHDKTMLTNLLLAYNWHPGSWFYIVFDEARDTKFLAYKKPGDRTLRLKLTYFMNAG